MSLFDRVTEGNDMAQIRTPRIVRPRITRFELAFIIHALKTYSLHNKILSAEYDAMYLKWVVAEREFHQYQSYASWQIIQELKPKLLLMAPMQYERKSAVAELLANRLEAMTKMVHVRVHHKNTADATAFELSHLPEYEYCKP